MNPLDVPVPADSTLSAPLSGVLVADFSRVLAGPLATTWLADLGATVVKVERSGEGDETRNWGPPWAASSSSYFAAANRSKLSMTLDLSDPEDAAVGRELAARADVLVENFKTGALAKFGLDYASIAPANTKLVYASITGFGSDAGASVPGYDFVVQAVGGLMSITGEPDGEPTKVGVALVDVLTAKDAVIGILAALRNRAATGVGDHVEVNLLSSLLGSLVNQASSYLTTGRSPGRLGNQHPSIAPYESLRCGEGLLAVACGNDGQFRRLAGLLGIPELVVDQRFSTNSTRVANRTELVTCLETALARRTAAEWVPLLTAAGVPAGQVGTVADGFAYASALGLKPTVEMPTPHPPQVSNPVRFSNAELRHPLPPPDLGSHGGAVRAWLANPGPITQLEDLLSSQEVK